MYEYYRKTRRWIIAIYAIIIAAICLGILIGPRLKIIDDNPSPSAPTENAQGTEPAENAPGAEPAPGAPSESAPGGEYIASPAPAEGETKRYVYQNLEIELTNVLYDRTETMLDDGGGEWRYVVISCRPGAALTVVNADMSDPAYAEDGLAHPQWAILVDPADPSKSIRLTDGMEPVEITPEMRGVYNLESSLYVFRFELSEGEG